MTAEKKHTLHWFGGIFEPTVDFYAMLNRQVDKTLEGMEALREWIKEGGEEGSQRVRELERQADELQMELEKKLVISFVTPFDREDIYELSASLDEVINSAKGVVREMEAMNVSTNGFKLLEMAEIIVEGTRSLQSSVHSLKKDLRDAAQHALQARKTDTRFGKVYRPAMRELLETDDFKTIFRVKEVYKVMLLASERIDQVGERLLHAIVKMS